MLSMPCVSTVARREMETMMIRSYYDLIELETFEERYEYLKLGGVVGESTFGYDRYLNQVFYKSKLWLRTRDIVIVRDEGCDLGIYDREIYDRIIVHHMNPITIEDIQEQRPELFDPELLICTTSNTHKAIHFGDDSLLTQLPITRTRNDTIPWI